jgi:hemolysin activation/secretion protein
MTDVVRSRHARALLFMLLAGASAAAAAQVPENRPRTGPEATPPATPAFPTPQPERVAPIVAPPPAPLPADAGTTIREVRIAANSDGARSVPPRRWQPPQEALSGLRLEHRRGAALDADWVRRQFALNQVEGGSAGRAIALVQLINRAFLTAGFVNSGLLVPVQSEAGVLDLQLIYGGLAGQLGAAPVQVSWAGDRRRGLDADYIRDRMPSAAGQPLDALAIERDFRRLADDPAIRTVNAQLVPGAMPGQARLQLEILARERTDFYLTAGNSRSPSVGGERIAAGGFYRHLLAGGDLLSGEFGTTEGVSDASLAYSLPLFSPRTTLTLRGSYNRAAVVDRPLVPLDIRSRERSAEATLVERLVDVPLMPAGEGGWTPSRLLSFGAGLAWRRQKSFLLGLPFSFAPGSVDGRAEYGAGRLLADFVLRDVDQVFAVSATGTVGLWGTRSDNPLVRSPERHFLALLVQANYARRLTASGLELRGRLTGQTANSLLYSGERIGVGGVGTVRGYREALILADRALIGSVELAWPFNLGGNGRPSGGFDWGAFTIAAFVDAATVRNAEPPHPVPQTLLSVGASLEWRPSDGVALSVAYGLALKDADQTGSRDIQDHGVHIRLTVHPFALRGR